MNDAVTARKQYRTLRAASALSAKEFDDRAQSLAHEFADGENVLPRHWVMGASQLLWDRGEWKDGML